MSNSDFTNEQVACRLLDLTRRHRELDVLIKECYSSYAPSYKINRLKTMKLWFKDEIHRLNEKLKAQHET
jgi:hypothetical protein